MNRTMKIIISIIVILIILTVAAAYWLAGFVMESGDRQSLDEAFQWQSKRYDTSFYKDLEKTDYTVKGADDYVLHAELLTNPVPTDKYVIISHGYTDNRMGALKYVPMYLDLGYNCVIYDLRGHGENESTFTTYGVLEGQDLDKLIKDTRKRYPDLRQLGIHGESLGAATTITSLKYKPDVDFVVADCGFSDIENVLKLGYKNAHAPTFLVDLANIGAKFRYHYVIKDMRPIDSLKDNELPILFLHGADDPFILPANSERMAKATKGYSEIHLIKGAEHAESVMVSPDEYAAYVKNYLESLGLSD